MKQKIIIAITGIIVFMITTSLTNKEYVINVMWKIEDANAESDHAICFKHDHTFWHYFIDKNETPDSVRVGGWQIIEDRIYLSCQATDVESFQIMSCNNTTLVIKNTRDNRVLKYTKNQ